MGSPVFFIALGSWGDVAPVLRVAHGLRLDGVGSRIAVGSDYVARVEAQGFEAVDLGVQVEPLLASEIGQDWIKASAKGQQATVKASAGLFTELAPTASEAVASSIKPGETLISGMMTFGLGAALAEVRAMPHAQLLFMPLSPSHKATATAFPVTPWPSGLNRWSTGQAQRALERVNREWVNNVRWHVGRKAWTLLDYQAAFESTPVIYGVSPQFLPLAPDWPRHTVVTGHLLAENQVSTQPGLIEFLEENPRAIYIGFGSFNNSLSVREWDIAFEALKLTGRAAVVASPIATGLVPDAPTPVYAAGRVSHTWLFPRLASVVHHGGAGVAQATAVSGVPSVTVPVVGDQPYWARRLEQLGVGAKPIPYSRLTARNLADAINLVTDSPRYVRKVRTLKRLMLNENGPKVAAEFIKSL
ncbi:MAG: hypothetical protein LBE83_01305 [Propionibacteriaceae bacterium]|jgi:UDP:flavonoid glycosyltransferase YjiC (YdhE family)|nr:hypothetical protein [Propionibacteriaceae bacterium]